MVVQEEAALQKMIRNAEEGEYRTLPDRAVYWSRGGMLKKDIRDERNFNHDVAHAWIRKKNGELEDGEASYTMMENLPEGAALSSLCFSNVDTSQKVSRAKGNHLIIHASDRFTRNAMGIVHFVGFNSSPDTNAQRIEFVAPFEGNAAITHVNLIELQDYDVERPWKFRERLVTKNDFLRLMRTHWTDVVLSRAEAGICKRRTPFLRHDRKNVEYENYLSDCQAQIICLLDNTLQELDRYQERIGSEEEVLFVTERLRCLAEFLTRYPIGVDILSPENADESEKGREIPFTVYTTCEGLFRNLKYSEEEYDSIREDSEKEAQFVYEHVVHMKGRLQRLFPELEWERVHIHSVEEYINNDNQHNPCGTHSSLEELRAYHRKLQEQAPAEVAQGDFDCEENGLVIKVGDRPHGYTEPLNDDFLRQRPIAERYCEARNSEDSEVKYMTLNDLTEGRALSALRDKSAAFEPSYVGSGTAVELKRNAYRKLLSNAGDTVTLAGHPHGDDDDFHYIIWPAIMEAGNIKEIRVVQADRDDSSWSEETYEKHTLNCKWRQKWLEQAEAKAREGLAKIASSNSWVCGSVPLVADLFLEIYQSVLDFERFEKYDANKPLREQWEAHERNMQVYRCARLIGDQPLLFDVFNNTPFGEKAGMSRWCDLYSEDLLLIGQRLAIVDEVPGWEADQMLEYNVRYMSTSAKESCAWLVEQAQWKILEVLLTLRDDRDWSLFDLTSRVEAKAREPRLRELWESRWK